MQVALQGLRSERGRVHVCLTRSEAHFPDCASDPKAVRGSFDAVNAGHFSLDVPAGHYALSVVHDENGNGKLDTFLKIPREGFGFSRNPPIRMGPPRFDEARFSVTGAQVTQSIRLKYIL